MVFGMNFVIGIIFFWFVFNFVFMFFVYVIFFLDFFDGDFGVCKQFFEDGFFLFFGFINECGLVGDKKLVREERVNEMFEGIGMGGEKDVLFLVLFLFDKLRFMFDGRYNIVLYICFFFLFCVNLKLVFNFCCVIIFFWQCIILLLVIFFLFFMQLYVDFMGGWFFGRLYVFVIFDLFEMEDDDC